MNYLDGETRVTRATYNRIAVAYCQKTLGARMRPKIIAALHEFEALLPRSSNVLVLGCGDGRDAQILAARGHRCILVDFSEAMLALSMKVVPECPKVLADFRRFPLKRETCDGVWASTCLYHIRKSSLRAVIYDISKVLKRRGIFYCNLRRGAGEGLDQNPRSFPDGGPRFYAFYSQAEVLDLFSQFEVLKFVSYDDVLQEDYFQLWLRRP